MKIKLDENLGRKCAEMFRRAGFDISTVAEQGMCSSSDTDLITECAHESRCLITLDLDFANPLVFNPTDYAGIAVLRLPAKPEIQDLFAEIQTLIEGLNRTDIAGKLWIIQRGRIRQYNPEE